MQRSVQSGWIRRGVVQSVHGQGYMDEMSLSMWEEVDAINQKYCVDNWKVRPERGRLQLQLFPASCSEFNATQ